MVASLEHHRVILCRLGQRVKAKTLTRMFRLLGVQRSVARSLAVLCFWESICVLLGVWPCCFG